MIIVIQIGLIVLALFGVGVIVLTKNVIHAAYALALTLISIAGIYVLLNAELLAVVQILLYAGGVVVLLVFGVMITNRRKGSVLISESKNVFVGAVLSLGVFALLCYLLAAIPKTDISAGTEKNQIESIGILFLTEHIVAFELIAFVLLVALVGASYLAKMSTDE